MALNLQDKKALVAEVAEVAARAQSVVAAEYRGLTVGQMTELRAKARRQGVYMRVVKNTLARKALAGTSFESVGPKLDRKSTRLNSSHLVISYAVFCLKKKSQRDPARHRYGQRAIAHRRRRAARVSPKRCAAAWPCHRMPHQPRPPDRFPALALAHQRS